MLADPFFWIFCGGSGVVIGLVAGLVYNLLLR